MPPGERVLVSSHRLKRPRQGQQEASGADYCPAASAPATNSRAGSEANPAHTFAFVPDNDSGAPQAGKSGYAQQKRGMSHSMGGSNPAGKPLVHKHGRKKFLLF